MDANSEVKRQQRAALYKVLYFWYRFLSIMSLAVLGGEGIRYWFSGSRSPLALVALVVTVGYWSVVLWSVPYTLSGQWERDLPEYAVTWRPSILWIPLFVLVFAGMSFFHAVMLFLMVLALMPSLWQLLPLMIGISILFVTVPLAIGMIRLYWHMRTGSALEYRRAWADSSSNLAAVNLPDWGFLRRRGGCTARNRGRGK